jgi:DNA-directed RNA polymerase subunit omega
MGLETLVSKALKQTSNDRYLLAVIVSKRAEELNRGAKPLTEEFDIQKDKFADIAIFEVAEGLLDLSEYVETIKK